MSHLLRHHWERRQAARRLRDLAPFSDCSLRELMAIDVLLTEVVIPAERTLMRQGTRGLDFVIVIEGTAAVERDRRRLGEVGPGSFFGELALLYGATRTATVASLTPMRLYVLNPFEFERLLEVAPTVRALVVETAASRMRALAHADAA